MTPLYPILPVDAAQASEAALLNGDPRLTAAALHQAGNAVAEALLADFRELREWPAAPRLLVLAGKGLNTGDALVACATLRASLPGLRVELVMTEAEADLNPLCADALAQLCAAMGDDLRCTDAAAFLAGPQQSFDVVLDGLYGHGFRPPLREPAAALLAAVNAHGAIGLRAAIDLPSGIGATADPGAFTADFTYIPGVAKAPCFDLANAAKVGRIRFLEIPALAAQATPAGQQWFVAAPGAHRALNRLRPSLSDKRSFGHVLILAGSQPMPGAALMATRAALQAGAGLVTTLAPASVASVLAGHVPEAMWRPLANSPEGGLDPEAVRSISQLSPRAHALLIGPGLMMDRSTVFTICRIIRECPLPLVLDASALTQDIISSVLGRPLSAGPVVITPHQGEFARLVGLKDDPHDTQSLLGFSVRYRAVTVLKGSPTIVCDGQRLVAVPAGGPVLARGGSGDLLAGILLARLASQPDQPFEAALQAVAWHGAAADSLARQHGAIAVSATQLLDHLAHALRA